MDIVDAINGYNLLENLAEEIAAYAYKLKLLDYKHFSTFTVNSDDFAVKVDNGWWQNEDYFDWIFIPLINITQNTWKEYLHQKVAEQEVEKEIEAQLKEQREKQEFERLKLKYEALCG
ncbi:MAG: hypothetical protein NC344_05685 [Bacteroidales bacterium]|nr:hypothetical protein [Bacteroidales bacterium]MCM1147311.1 hypothetical protein [Bacteroidales bacterium]MCM1206255.1 hypothetical protein [Bacillota bacterium]